MTTSSLRQKFPLHYLVWENNYTKLDEELNKSNGNIEQLDARGKTPLMLAVCLGKIESCRVLLAHNANACVTNSRHWSITQEAISTGHPELLRLVLIHRDAQRIKNQATLTSKLLSDLKNAPDFFVEMKWEFFSWIPLFSSMCPSDVCRIWKKGSSLRVDTTILGMSSTGNWLKGNISYIFKLTANGAILDEINHSKATVFRHDIVLNRTNEAYLEQEHSDDIIATKLTQPNFVTYLDMERVELEKSKAGFMGWLHDRKEEVDGQECIVYSAGNVQIVTLRRTEHLSEEEKNKLRDSAAAASSVQSGGGAAVDLNVNAISSLLSSSGVGDQPSKRPLPQLSAHINESEITPELYFDSAQDLGLRDIGRPKEMISRIKSFKAHIWLRQEFPISLRDQIMPAVNLMAEFCPLFDRLRKFIGLQMPSGFPLKIEVPLYHILNARITFSHINQWHLKHASTSGATTNDSSKQHQPPKTCEIEDDVFNTPSVYYVVPFSSAALHNASGLAGGIDEEDHLIQMALQQSLLEFSTGDPRSKYDLSQKKGRMSTDATNYYGEEDAILQKAIEESLHSCRSIPVDFSSKVSSEKTESSDSNVLNVVLEASKRQKDLEEERKKREDDELQKILELSKIEK